LTVETLRTQISGNVVAPEDGGFDAARQAWNLAVDQRPALVALPESVDDVVAIVEFARANGYRVAPQGTGHNAGPLGPLDETVLLKTERMRSVAIDAERRTARVEAGVLWAEVVQAAAEHGLAARAGSSPDVGVVGYTLGGGISWLARRHGLAANAVTAVELVAADGRLVRADATENADLFWALRGGGGSFGVVTALEFELLPLTEVYAGALFWPIERGEEILVAWSRWVDDVPDEITSVGRLLQLPPIPEIPEPFRGRSFVVVEAVHVGTEEAAAPLFAPLSALEPELDTFATVPVTALQKLHMDPEQPVPSAGDGMALEAVTPDTVAVLARLVPGSPLLSVEVRQLGGALARTAEGHGAIASIEAPFMFFAVGMAMNDQLEAAIRGHIETLQAALAPWEARHMYLNFAEHRKSPQRLFPEESYRRLAVVKAQWDADDVIRSNHPIKPATVVSREPRRSLIRRTPGR
jgi:hypothetical protein